jgi:hypothetical protein
MRSGYYRIGSCPCPILFPPASPRPRRPIALQEDELDEFRFVEPAALDDYLPAIISTRVAAAIRGRDAGTTAYLPWTEP